MSASNVAARITGLKALYSNERVGYPLLGTNAKVIVQVKRVHQWLAPLAVVQRQHLSATGKPDSAGSSSNQVVVQRVETVPVTKKFVTSLPSLLSRYFCWRCGMGVLVSQNLVPVEFWETMEREVSEFTKSVAKTALQVKRKEIGILIKIEVVTVEEVMTWAQGRGAQREPAEHENSINGALAIGPIRSIGLKREPAEHENNINGALAAVPLRSDSSYCRR